MYLILLALNVQKVEVRPHKMVIFISWVSKYLWNYIFYFRWRFPHCSFCII